MGTHLFFMITNNKRVAEFNNVMEKSEIRKKLINPHSFCGVNDESDIKIAK